MIEFARDLCGDLQCSGSREWLETNGIGGFASSTICGMNTRRYHGLLVAATKPPVGRTVLLSKLEETVTTVDGRRLELGTNQYPGSIHPRGFEHLSSFRLDPWPVFTFELGGSALVLEKSVFLVHGENTVVIEYRLLSGESCDLELRPLIAFRDYHATTHRNDSIDPRVVHQDGLVAVRPYPGLPALYFGHNASSVDVTGHWYFDFEYAIERERGLDFREDLFQPFAFRARLEEGKTVTIIASTERRSANRVDGLRQSEQARRAELTCSAALRSAAGDELAAVLSRAADQFIVERDGLHSVIAGYPWFGDWGRDTMIALPGLTLATGRYTIARDILLAFASCISQGMLPNRFPDSNEQPEYNTVDATLWYFEAIRAYEAATDDTELVRGELYPKMKEIIDWHFRGTRYSIRCDADGLLSAGEPGVQLTWMDAKVGDWVVTPRTGKPVEVQALWYNALRITEMFARRFHDTAFALQISEAATRASVSFNRLFWNEATGCLFDVVSDDWCDGSIRPNQIFAVSLGHTMLTDKAARRVVDVVERELLTPFGLRTLAASHPQYCARYEGGVRERDGAYHQGTVWPWLIGSFVQAFLRVHGNTPDCKQKCREMLAPMKHFLGGAGTGQLPEIADGDSPHAPRGCPAQAWSVACFMQAVLLCED